MNYIGAHINKDGSILNTISKITANNGNAIQIFASSPMNSSLPDLDKFKKESKEIINYCNENDFKVVVHGSYVINLANTKINKRYVEIQDRWWIKLLIAELDACEIINGIGVVVHVGKYTTSIEEDGFNNMYLAIKYILKYLKENKYNSKLIIETPAGVGTELLVGCDKFIKFYDKFDNDDKKYLGICLDTAHIWSSGYNLVDYYNNMKKYHKDILVIHYNNSKMDKGSKVDRHETILEGKISYNDMKKFLLALEKKPIIILEKPSNRLNEDISFIKKVI